MHDKSHPIVYVAGPFRGSAKIIRRNIMRADNCGRYLDRLGCQALVPHTMYGSWHGHVDEEHMIEVTKAWLQICDAMLVCVTEAESLKSDGTVGEVLECERRGLPVFYVDEDGGASVTLEEWLAQGREPREDRTLVRRAQWFLAGVSRMLAAKNRAYGNSIGAPLRVFSKATEEERVRSRCDDKLKRIMCGDGSGDEDAVADLVGYLALLAGLRENARG